MLSKIEIYREVLEIEPNSKVFFPLARALAEEGRHDEAAAVLARGIGFHPDHLEAKFLLIELLARQGREGEADQVFAEVGALLARYPSVWLLWSKHAAARAKDPSLAMLFLAHYFQNQTLTWADVMERGLQSLSQAAGSVEPAAGGAGEGEDAAGGPQQPEPSGTVPVAAEPAGISQDAASHEASPVEKGGPDEALAQPSPAEVEPVAELATQDAVEPVAESGILPFDEGIPSCPESAQPETAAGPELRGAREVMELAGLLDVPEAPEPRQRSKPAKGREQAVRTRTMAAVLAEQGDLTGARAIYEELLTAAVSEAEREELRALMDALTPRGTASSDVASATPEAAVVPETAGPGRSKTGGRLADFLEALASRLETRAGS